MDSLIKSGSTLKTGQHFWSKGTQVAGTARVAGRDNGQTQDAFLAAGSTLPRVARSLGAGTVVTTQFVVGTTLRTSVGLDALLGCHAPSEVAT